MKTGSIVGLGVGLGILAVAGVFLYFNALPPNILISEIDIDPIKNEQFVTVQNLGRVYSSDSFNYYSKDGGTYFLIFSNSFSVFSDKSVSVSYTDKGKSYQKNLYVPAGYSEEIEVFVYPKQSVSGQMQIRGGSGDDVNFRIVTEECTQRVSFSFALFNAGQVNGDATVKLLAGDSEYWSSNYVLAANEKITRSDSVTIPNCKDLKLVISEQKSTGYLSSLFKR